MFEIWTTSGNVYLSALTRAPICHAYYFTYKSSVLGINVWTKLVLSLTWCFENTFTYSLEEMVELDCNILSEIHRYLLQNPYLRISSKVTSRMVLSDSSLPSTSSPSSPSPTKVMELIRFVQGPLI